MYILMLSNSRVILNLVLPFSPGTKLTYAEWVECRQQLVLAQLLLLKTSQNIHSSRGRSRIANQSYSCSSKFQIHHQV